MFGLHRLGVAVGCRHEMRIEGRGHGAQEQAVPGFDADAAALHLGNAGEDGGFELLGDIIEDRGIEAVALGDFGGVDGWFSTTSFCASLKWFYIKSNLLNVPLQNNGVDN